MTDRSRAPSDAARSVEHPALGQLFNTLSHSYHRILTASVTLNPRDEVGA